MSMKKLTTEVTDLIDREYGRAAEQHGVKHYSPHEAYAVIKEEIEEAQDELEVVEDKLDEFWKAAKRDFLYGCNLNAEIIYKRAMSGACELIQVAAMAKKALQGYENGET